ncbi:uncharacterized protein LOC124930123 [Impatiens glandulifera]|uniref:uncharacterized protein LOC124930123 n=1 Tax=Impatiens glandulifera TaxID=253017 RepID=UPI001FB07921|nr:uncharacterized protein LOC124930123 [Impatiens glandulifera]
MESDLHLSLSPSFNSYCNVNLAIVDRVVNELKTHSNSKFQNSSPAQEQKDQIFNDFEFSSISRDSISSPVSAEDIFHNGQIRPLFPISKQDLYFSVDEVKPDCKKSSVRRIPLGQLFSEDRDPPPSSSPEKENEDFKAVSMDRTSSSSRNEKRWRFRNILQRSNSEAKESFVVVSPKRSRSKNQNFTLESPKASVDKRRAKFGNVEAVTSSPPQEAVLHLRNRPGKEADRRRSFLPYRRDLIGFFANVY